MCIRDSHYGVRGKSIEIDMSTSHMETVDVPSYWTKGLVRNVDTDTDYYKIQHAIDNASAGDTLNVWAWTYNESLVIDESISIVGNSSSSTTVFSGYEEYDSSYSYAVNIVSNDVYISNINFTVTNTSYSGIIRSDYLSLIHI